MSLPETNATNEGDAPETAPPATAEPAGPGGSLRLLFAVPFAPRLDNPHGGRVVAQLLTRLTGHHRLAVVTLAAPDAPTMDPALASRCERVETVRLRPRRWISADWQHRMRVLSLPLTLRPTPAAAFYSPYFAAALRDVAADWKPDVVQLEHDGLLYCARAVGGLARARILVCHEPGMAASANLAGVTSGRQRLAHRLDAAAWRRYLRSYASELDAAVAFTEQDAQALTGVVPSLRVVRISLGIDLPATPLSPAGVGEPVALYVGGYSHRPNEDAALRLERSIMPLVRRRLPNLRLLLVGATPSDAMRAAASEADTITGEVPSVEPYMDQAALVVLPIRIGGGMRVKLLEALAAGKAVVASPLAAAGLELTSGQQIVLADTDDEFAKAIVDLLADHAAREQLGRNARSWAVAHLSWESRVTQYERLYRSLLSADQ